VEIDDDMAKIQSATSSIWIGISIRQLSGRFVVRLVFFVSINSVRSNSFERMGQFQNSILYCDVTEFFIIFGVRA
jgi:hypothetical protein